MTVALIKRIIFALLLLCVISCSKTDTIENISQDYNSIAYLKSQLRGNTTAIVEDIIINGYVVANDFYSEQYKSIIISDYSGGLEINIDADNLYQRFPIFSNVTIHCTTLWVGEYGGRVILGERPTGEYSVDRIDEENINRYIKINTDAKPMALPQSIDISDIDERHIGNIYLLEDVCIISPCSTWCLWDTENEQYIATEHTVEDRHGNKISLRIPQHVTYAAEKIPQGWGSMVVIVEYFNGEYSLAPTNYQFQFNQNYL